MTKTRFPLLLIALLLVAFTACSGDDATPTPSATLPPPLEASLHRDESVTYNDVFTVIFYGVSQDSRCAEGVQCVRAGEAYVQMSFELVGLDPADATLVIESMGETWSSYAGYLVTLTKLEPDPPPVREADDFIDYVAHIRIEKVEE